MTTVKDPTLDLPEHDTHSSLPQPDSYSFDDQSIRGEHFALYRDEIEGELRDVFSDECDVKFVERSLSGSGGHPCATMISLRVLMLERWYG